MTEIFEIQSDEMALSYVEERLFHFCRQMNVGNYYSAVSTAVLQAVENAVVHGNRSNPEKSVKLTFGTCRGGIYVEVSDQGEGFDASSYGNLPNDDASTGMGIYVMKQLSDNLEYSDDGRCVRMEFMVAGIDPADAIERIAVLQERKSLVAVR